MLLSIKNRGASPGAPREIRLETFAVLVMGRTVMLIKSVTLKDVAKAANVSYATVSRALSGSPQIGSDTRERILKLCNDNGFGILPAE